MRGVIFRTYLNFISDRFNHEVLDDILQKDDYPNKGGFSSAGNYKVKYLHSLISNTAYLFSNSKELVLSTFGEYAFKFLLDRFKKLYKNTNTPLHTDNAYDFLEQLNVIHFDELKKIYPDAKFPKFDIQRKDTRHIVIEYSSHRNLPHLVYGLIQGCLKYFDENSSLSMEKTQRLKIIKGQEVSVYKFEVKYNG